MTNQERPVGEQEQIEDLHNVATQTSDAPATSAAPTAETQHTSSEAREQDTLDVSDAASRAEETTTNGTASTSVIAAAAAPDVQPADESVALDTQAGETDAISSTAPVAKATDAEATQPPSDTAVADAAEADETVTVTDTAVVSDSDAGAADAADESVALDTQAGETDAISSSAPVADAEADQPSADATSSSTDELASDLSATMQTESDTSDVATPEAIVDALGVDSAAETAPQVEAAEAPDQPDTSAALDTQAGETDAISSTAPVAEAATDEAATSAEPTEEGASYTPVAEEDTGKPRRLKDVEPGMELEGRVTSIALYGIFVDVGVGRDGLVHISEMSDTRIDSPSDLVQIGNTVKVRVKSVDPEGRRISLTMRSPEREPQSRSSRGGRKRPELDRERLASLRVGDTIEGTVTGIAPFGVFVDIGVGKDGLVHISELAEGRIERAEDAVQVGQTYTFKLLEVDAEGTRISLSLRRAQRTQRMQELEKGQIFEGTISGVAPFGAFVDIGVGRDGLVHISELSADRVNKVEDVVNVGDKVTARVLEVDPQSKRISLSLLLEDRPQADTERREERPRRDRPSRPPRQSSGEDAVPSQYTVESEPEEDETPTNATLEDLLSKYGNGGRRDNKRRRYEEDEEEEEGDTEDRNSRRQRDAIRRTLNLGDDE